MTGFVVQGHKETFCRIQIWIKTIIKNEKQMKHNLMDSTHIYYIRIKEIPRQENATKSEVSAYFVCKNSAGAT